MNTSIVSSLNENQQHALDALHAEPMPHDLDWKEVLSLLRNVAHIEQKPNGNLLVMRNEQSLVLRPALSNVFLETEEIATIRDFLSRSDAGDAGASGEADHHWLLVIDHQRARLFHTVVRGAVVHQVLPHNPDDYFRHAHESMNFTRGKERPDPNDFFEPIAEALSSAGCILIFGTGTGMSSEMDQFISWLRAHHPALADKIIGSVAVDEHHLTEAQLLEKAREFYVSHNQRLRTL